MLMILPLWTGLLACGLVGVVVVGYPVPVDRGCVLRNNSGPHQTIGLLTMLTDLFGETLMTESNDKTYYVSICRTIPLYGSRSLAGAVQYNSKGEYVILGEIDKAEVVVNEKTFVLTYIGSEINKNLNEECNGNSWKTYLTFMCDPYVTNDTLKLVDEDRDQHEMCQIKFEIQTSKICRLNSNVVVRTPVIYDKYKNLLSVINGSHYINNTQYSNRSTNKSIVNDANSNNLDNYGHDEFVYIQNKSNQQNLHQGDSNNYIREPYYKRRLMMNSDNSTLAVQPAENIAQEINAIYNELMMVLVKLFLIFIPKPMIVAVGVVLSIYYRWTSIIKCIKKYISSKTPESAESMPDEKTHLIPFAHTSNGKVTLNQGTNEGELIGVVNVDVVVNGPQSNGENASQAATGFSFIKIIPRPVWIVIGGVAVVMLIAHMQLGVIVFCSLWIWCIWKSGQTGDENTPLIPVKDTNSNGKVTQNQGENEEKIIGIVKVGVEVKGLQNNGEKDEETASQGPNGFTTVVHVEPNTLASAGKIEGTEDTTTDVSSESTNLTHNPGENNEESLEGANGSTEVHVEPNTLASAGKIKGTKDTTTDVSSESTNSKESDVYGSKENRLEEKKIDS